jgi:hypothetical protein
MTTTVVNVYSYGSDLQVIIKYYTKSYNSYDRHPLSIITEELFKLTMESYFLLSQYGGEVGKWKRRTRIWTRYSLFSLDPKNGNGIHEYCYVRTY